MQARQEKLNERELDRLQAQLDLFDEYRPYANSEALMKTIDELNHSEKGKVWFAGQRIRKNWGE